jgi:hypothetical protein
MKTNLIIMLIMCLLGFHKYSSSQIIYDYKPVLNTNIQGYVITRENDTIRGTLRLSNELDNQEQIVLIDNYGFEKTYPAAKLKAARYGNIYLTLDTLYKGRPLLVQTLNKGGYLTLYVLYVNGGQTIERYLIKRGDQKIERIRYFKDLSIYTWDHPETRDIIYKGKYQIEHLNEIINNYNIWLINTGRIKNRMYKDSINMQTKLSLQDAENANILRYCASDSNMAEYFNRIENYGPNSLGYKYKVMFQKRDGKVNVTYEGLAFAMETDLFRIGTWRYYYPAKIEDEPLQIKKEEYYNASGKLDGDVIYYDINGKTIKTEKYFNGEQIKAASE